MCFYIQYLTHFRRPPRTMEAIVAWIKNNPGKFTYINPTKDFLGAAFVKHMFYAYAKVLIQILTNFDENLYNQLIYGQQKRK